MLVMRSQVVASLMMAYLALLVKGSLTDWNGMELSDGQESEETIERDRLLLEEWERMNNSVYAKYGPAKEPGETLHLFKSMLEVEGKFSPRTIARRQQIREKTEKLVTKSHVSNLKCTNLFHHIELNYLIHENLNNSLNVLPYLNHCKLEQFLTCKDFWSGKLRSIVEKIDEHDRRIMEELVRTIKSTLNNGENQFHQASDGLNFEEVRQAIRHATGLAKMKLDEMIDIYNQFVCDPQFASLMDQQTLDWSITGNICRIIMRMLEFLFNEKHFNDETSQLSRDGSQTDQCWWFAE